MAEITNAQVVKFANERARTMADEIVYLDRLIAAWLADWTAQGMSAAITADAAGTTSNITDGSETDGRQRVTGTELVNLRAALLQLQASLAAVVSGVGASPRSIADGIQVNGSTR
jgi:hypothetical protein